jgi:transaldolase
MTESELDQLKKMTVVVVDSSDIEAIREFHPRDATTNPSLILQASQKPEYRPLIEKAISEVDHGFSLQERRANLIDHLFVNFGLEILKIVPGRISTEVDATLSFDTKGSIERALHLVSLYEKAGIPRERVLIKLASTWEGIRAAEVLEMEGVHCNMTLLFSLAQAIACADAKATLISPFVGRVLDWHKKNDKEKSYDGKTDPGVLLVHSIYNYYKKFNFTTEIMGASFRNKDEILALAGCDLLTISPKFLAEMSSSFIPIEPKLSTKIASESRIEKIILAEPSFRYLFNEDPCAVEKLSEGIRTFAEDTKKLEHLIQSF